MDADWICQICHEAIHHGAGFIVVHNRDAELGPVGGYPIQRSDELQETVDLLAGDSTSPDWWTLANVSLILDFSTRRIGFLVVHAACDPWKGVEEAGYNIGTNEVTDLKEWVGWILQLSEHHWMGRRDIIDMISFFWSHRGDDPP